MSAPFAALEARANAAICKQLANASATVGGVTLDALFDNGYANTLLGTMGGRGVSFAGMAGSKPTLTLPTASVPANPVGQAAVVNSVNYLVAAHEPDGTGISVLLLEIA